ncbi:MAG: hypothetical protein QM736_00600 [Vicinamibacterales bacterium]
MIREATRARISSLAAAFAATSASAAAEGPQTITGELISVWCYIQSPKNVGEAGYVCALADLKWEGNPPGVLTASGVVYQLAGPALGENNASVVPLIGRTVSATGEVIERDGVRILTASQLKAVAR